MDRNAAPRRVLFLRGLPDRTLADVAAAGAIRTLKRGEPLFREAAYVLDAAGGETTFPLRETNVEIGGHVGTVREVVSRTLHGLEDGGAIRLDGRRVTLLDREALRIVAKLSETEDTVP